MERLNELETPLVALDDIQIDTTTLKPAERPVRRTRRTAEVLLSPETAPQLFCPGCALPLVYRRTVVGGVQPPERWVYFACRTCGDFVYRDRTRQVRRVTA
jgi:hypothetical protein